MLTPALVPVLVLVVVLVLVLVYVLLLVLVLVLVLVLDLAIRLHWCLSTYVDPPTHDPSHQMLGSATGRPLQKNPLCCIVPDEIMNVIDRWEVQENWWEVQENQWW